MPLRPAALRSAALALTITQAWAAVPEHIEFNRDVRPILSENCLQCHGQDPAHREGKLRLDDRDSATRERSAGTVIVPGRPEESEMIARLLSTDDDERMPPLEANKHVSPDQITLLKRWISQGANYQKHWAFIPPVRASLPDVSHRDWSRTALDRFVLARLEKEGLTPAPTATPQTWLRRVSFDLTGLPPTPGELDAFALDVSTRGDAAYADAADRLLASPHFGERLALDWLDAARYADSHGFNNDGLRTMWRWRDWVIDAFNENMPYDRFITEQLAGDLLPKPTLEQRIATGFGRNHVINSEGGIIDEEYRVEYVADRVRTTSTAWLGLTMECCRCHDHKFDPLQQRDYYRFFALFNNVPEYGEDGRRANAVPIIAAPTRPQQTELAHQLRALTETDARLNSARAGWRWQASDRERILAAIEANRAPAPAKDAVELIADMVALPISSVTAAAPKIAATKFDFNGSKGGTVSFWLNAAPENPSDVALLSNLNYDGSPADAAYGRGSEIRLIIGEIELRLSERYPVYGIAVRSEGAAIAPGISRHVTVSYAGGRNAADVRIFIDGNEVATQVLFDDLFVLSTSPQRDFLVGADNAKNSARFHGTLGEVKGFPRPLSAIEIHPLFLSSALPRALAHVDASNVSERETQWLRDTVLESDAAFAAARSKHDELWETHLALRRSLPSSMVMEELPTPRVAHLLERGNYDAPGEIVTGGAPEELLASWPAGAPRNRLGLAQWFTQSQNPLTARVVVNRFWAQLFGTGIVKTVEDFGSQGEWPSHPELLDYLARDFVDGGWNVKALFKTIVLSSTYRQNSAIAPELLARDPENRLLARGPRVRLPAELIRDQALAVSGLLTPRVGGPSVYPYQPDKLYDGIVVGTAYPGSRWTTSTGDDLYRRSLYTFWKRTVPHPAMRAFDAPDREVCTARRSRTNTPLQALVLWNEPGYLEAARHLGTRLLREGGPTDETRVAYGFRLATGRLPAAQETRVLVTTLATLRRDFSAHTDDAAALIKIGASPVDAGLSPAELAAATAVANMILSLDETLTKN